MSSVKEVYVRPDGTKRVVHRFDQVDESTGELLNPSLTKQSFKKDCDINHIMSKYEKTGLIEHVSRYQGQYGDFSELQDYQTSLNQVILADEMFMSLPATIRSQFENDAGKFLSFVDDPNNLDKMIEMGLAKPRPVESSDSVEVSAEVGSET